MALCVSLHLTLRMGVIVHTARKHGYGKVSSFYYFKCTCEHSECLAQENNCQVYVDLHKLHGSVIHQV